MRYCVTTCRQNGVVEASFLVQDRLHYRGQPLPAAACLARVIFHLEQCGIPYRVDPADPPPMLPTPLKWGLLGLGLVVLLAVTGSPMIGLIFLSVGVLIAFGLLKVVLVLASAMGLGLVTGSPTLGVITLTDGLMIAFRLCPWPSNDEEPPPQPAPTYTNPRSGRPMDRPPATGLGPP
jgi:hypothetical protein